MEPRRQGVLKELLETIEVLPEEQLREVTDFAGFLGEKRASKGPARGTAEALLKHAGSVRFEPGEMESVLSDIEHSRSLDLDSDA